MKRITIDIYDRDDAGLSGLIHIQSEEHDFMYANDKTGHGLQCKYKGGTDQYVALGFRLARIADLARKIELSIS